MKTVVVKQIIIDKEYNKYQYELTNDILCDDIDEEKADYHEIHSTENNLNTTIYYHEQENYFYCFID